MITPFRCAVDTLEATFTEELPAEILEELHRRKESAIANGTPDEIRLCNETFYVTPKGSGFWPYTVRNHDMILQLGAASNIPTMKVHLLAEGLASRGVEALWAKAREIADEFGLKFCNCTRVDIAMDYHGFFPTYAESLNVVCPAEFRPVYPNTIKPETFQFGQSDTVLRWYNKSVQIAAKHIEWWKFVWRLCDGYDESREVYRVEVQLRGKTLRELGFYSVEYIIESLPELFAYGMEWGSLRVPTEDSNRSRWPEDPRWTLLRTAFQPTRSLQRVAPARAVIEYDRAVKRMVSLISYAGVAMNSTEFWHIAKALTTDALQHIEREMETDLKTLVEKKRKQRHL